VVLVDILMVMSAQVMAFRYTNVQTADTQTFDILSDFSLFDLIN